MARVVHFEIHAQEPERAIAFYGATFGWRFNKWEGPMPYWLIETGSDDERGINGGLVERQGPAPKGGEPVTGFVCTVDIDDVDAYVDKAKAAGGSVAVEKMPIPGVGWLAYCKDTEGNVFGLMQPDEDAKQLIPQ